MTPTNEHQNRVAVITGGNGGIGAAITRRLQEHSATVHSLDIEAAPQSQRVAGSAGEFHHADIASQTDIELQSSV